MPAATSGAQSSHATITSPSSPNEHARGDLSKQEVWFSAVETLFWISKSHVEVISLYDLQPGNVRTLTETFAWILERKRVHMFSHFFLPTSKSISPFSVRSEMKLSRKREFCRNTIQYDGQRSQATSEKNWDVKICGKELIHRYNGWISNSGWEKKHAVLWPKRNNGPCYLKNY